MLPPLKWAGGKRWQEPYLRCYYANSTRRFVEPFAGGLGIAMRLEPRRVWANDINSHLITFYRWLQQGFTITLPMINDEATYYAYRGHFNALIDQGDDDTVEAASLFYYLNRTGFNGLCRFNKAGVFNVPFGSYANIPYEREFSAYRSTMAEWMFTAGSFEDMKLDDDDFVYADPPYDSSFTSYASQGFSWEQQVKVAAWLAQHPGPVILANRATDRIVALYEDLGYTLQFLEAPRRISCTGDRSPVREVLAMRNHE